MTSNYIQKQKSIHNNNNNNKNNKNNNNQDNQNNQNNQNNVNKKPNKQTNAKKLNILTNSSFYINIKNINPVLISFNINKCFNKYDKSTLQYFKVNYNYNNDTNSLLTVICKDIKLKKSKYGAF